MTRNITILFISVIAVIGIIFVLLLQYDLTASVSSLVSITVSFVLSVFLSLFLHPGSLIALVTNLVSIPSDAPQLERAGAGAPVQDESRVVSPAETEETEASDLVASLQDERNSTAHAIGTPKVQNGWRYYHDPELGISFQYPEYFGIVQKDLVTEPSQLAREQCRTGSDADYTVQCTGRILKFATTTDANSFEVTTEPFLVAHGVDMRIPPGGASWLLRSTPDDWPVGSSLNRSLSGEVDTYLGRGEPGGQSVQYVQGDGVMVSHMLVVNPVTFAIPTYISEERLSAARAELDTYERPGPQDAYPSYDAWAQAYQEYQEVARVDLSDVPVVQDYTEMLRSIATYPGIPSIALASELADLTPLLVHSCRSGSADTYSGYYTDGSNVHYVDRSDAEPALVQSVLTYDDIVDIATIQTTMCGEPFLVHDDTVVLKGQPVTVADPTHFTKIPLPNTTSPDLFRDRKQVYHYSATRGLEPIDAADPATFRSVESYAYDVGLSQQPYWFFRDKERFYCTFSSDGEDHVRVLPDVSADAITVTSTFSGEVPDARRSDSDLPYLSKRSDTRLEHTDGRIFNHRCEEIR